MKKPLIISAFIALIAAIVTPFIINAEDAASLQLSIDNAKDYYASGEEFTVNVNFLNPKSGAESLGTVVQFDESKLEFVKATSGIANLFNRGTGSYTNQVQIAYFTGDQGTTLDAGTLGTIKFRVKEGVTGSTEIRFSRVTLTDTDETDEFTAATSNLTVNFATSLQSISLSTTKDSIGTDETTTINVAYNPSTTTDTKTVDWSSSNTNIATVDATGKVTGVAPGDAIITATPRATGVAAATITIHVVSELQSISLNKSSLDMAKENSETLTVTYNPTNTTSNKSITWTSSNPSVATVDANGKVTAENYGTTTITATSVAVPTATATCEVTVSNHLQSISLSETEFNLNRGNEKALTVTYVAENPNDDTTDSKSIIWTSSDDSVAVVNSSGVVSATGKGTATITANASGVSGVPAATAIVHVSVPLQSIALEDNFELQPGSSKTIGVTYNPTDADIPTLTWTSSDTSKVTVNNSGEVTAVSPGSAVITVDAGNSITDTVTVTVPEIHVDTVVINKSQLTLEKGALQTLTASYLPENATDATDVTWSSQNSSIASVDSNGLVTAVSGGTTKIIAEINGITAECEVTVIVPLQSITLDEESINLNKNATTTVGYTINPTDTTDESPVTWTSQNTSVATVNATTGEIRGVAVGSAVIQVTKGNKSDTVTVNVKSPLTAISLNKTETTLVKKQSENLTVNYNPTDTTDNRAITWESSNTDVATVDNNGKITAKKEGTATITATSAVAGISPVSCTVTVTEIHIQSIQISNTIDTLPLGKTHQLNTVVTPNNTTDDYTLNWTSSDESVATVDSNGKITAKKAGPVTITVTTNGNSPLTDSIDLEVIEIPMTGVQLRINNSTMKVGDQDTLQITFTPSDTTDSRNVTYTSSDESILTVDSNGKITAKKKGKAVVTIITANGLKSQVEITVLDGESNSKSPKTFDSSIIYFVTLILSGVGLLTAVKLRRKVCKAKI